MAIKTTIGRLLVNDALPPQYRDYSKPLLGKDLNNILKDIAVTSPEAYKDVTYKLMSIGSKAIQHLAPTVTLDDLTINTKVKKRLVAAAKKQTEEILNSKNLSPAEKKQALAGIYSNYQKAIIDDTFNEALKRNSAYARFIQAGARGNKLQLAGMVATPAYYNDADNNPVPIFIEHSYAEGLTPAEFFAAAYGTRKGVKSTKFETRRGGDLGKQLMTAAGDLVVVKHDCGDTSGIEVDALDEDNIGSLLATPVAGYKAGTPITKEVLAKLKKKKVKTVMVRSPSTCKASKGVCAKCAGIRENNKLPEIGYNLGLIASQALTERLAQGALNVKHTSGQKTGDDSNKYVGFDYINRFLQVPKHYPDEMTLSELDGKVTSIKPAPQGGTYVFVNDTPHYVLPDKKINVKVGQTLEAGDAISNGVVNLSKLVKHKGIGETRRLFIKDFHNMVKNSGIPMNRRNIEALSRAFVRDVRVTDPNGAGIFLPDDVADYDSLAFGYKPRKDAKLVPLSGAKNKYLEHSVLHYSIGTRITDSVAKNLKAKGISKITVHPDPPGFEPEFVRMRAKTYSSPDWLGKLWSTHLKDNLITDTQKGRETDFEGIHPVPRLVDGLSLDKPFKNV